MGGGDLNLKKSWHPQTMRNIERVWKAEQKHEAERKKIEELQKELKEERAREEMTKFAQESGAIKRKDDRLDWMYQGPAGQVSRDEYLLGRPIDRQITDQYAEPESGPSAQTGLLPGSIFSADTAPASGLDMAAKIREDPLFEIRKREQDKKREVLTNPVKMKKIKEMLRQNLEKKEKKKRKRKEKKRERKEKRKDKKKQKRSRRRRSSGSSSSSSSSGSGSGSEEESDRTRSNGRHESREGPRTHHHSHYGLQVRPGAHQPTSFPRSRSRSPLKQSARAGGDKRPPASPPRERQRRQMTHVSKKLSADELERKRRAMMDEARQRDEERENNVRSYRRQEEQQERGERQRERRQHAGFIHDMKLQSAASSSLEDRVKRNIHSIQRTPAALDNFMRR